MQSQIKRNELLQKISTQLARIIAEVEIKNSINLFDVNQIAEDFYRDFLNNVFNTAFININIEKKNAAAIDLACKSISIAIQVTSDTSASKVHKTLASFLKNDLDKDYSTLRMLYLKKKTTSSTEYKTEGRVTLEKWDHTDLIKHIRALTTEQIEEVCKFLEKELSTKLPKQEANEVKTIIDLIEFISSSQASLADSNFEADPEKKIEKRFNEYADYLKTLYTDLFIIYNNALLAAEQASELDAVKLTKIRPYLKAKSIEILKNSQNNPQDALQKLERFFIDKISTSGIQYDESAIRFYLISQVLKCNIFPNEALV